MDVKQGTTAFISIEPFADGVAITDFDGLDYSAFVVDSLGGVVKVMRMGDGITVNGSKLNAVLTDDETAAMTPRSYELQLKLTINGQSQGNDTKIPFNIVRWEAGKCRQ